MINCITISFRNFFPINIPIFSKFIYFIYFTGKIDEINKFAKNWNIYWEKVSEGDGYTINHTAMAV